MKSKAWLLHLFVALLVGTALHVLLFSGVLLVALVGIPLAAIFAAWMFVVVMVNAILHPHNYPLLAIVLLILAYHLSRRRADEPPRGRTVHTHGEIKHRLRGHDEPW